jgi:hypothetical protein
MMELIAGIIQMAPRAMLDKNWTAEKLESGNG